LAWRNSTKGRLLFRRAAKQKKKDSPYFIRLVEENTNRGVLLFWNTCQGGRTFLLL